MTECAVLHILALDRSVNMTWVLVTIIQENGSLHQTNLYCTTCFI